MFFFVKMAVVCGAYQFSDFTFGLFLSHLNFHINYSFTPKDKNKNPEHLKSTQVKNAS